jgi:asparagine N-glycosylation enzyme membrane subunit Stt3
MERRWIFALIVLMAIVAAGSICYIYLLPEKPEKIEEIGGKYNVVIYYWKNNRTTIEYIDEAGKHSGLFLTTMRNALEWIKTNSPKDSVFLCWWDYGHMIKGYAERNVVIRNPSREILKSVTHPSKIKEFDPHERIVDVATAFSTTDPNEALRIMQRYGVSYVLVYEEDLYKAHWIFWTAGLNTTEYFYRYWPEKGYYTFSDKAKDTIIARLLETEKLHFSPSSIVIKMSKYIG